MLKKVSKLKYIIIILAIFPSIFAQEIYFCNSHTEEGEPIDARNLWSIKPWGSYVYILYDNEGDPIEQQLNYMFVDRYIDGSYRPFDSKAVNVKTGATWFAYNYKFTEPGKYKVYFVDRNKEELASETVTIQLESNYLNNRQGTTSLYYDGIKPVFCERVIAGKPINEFHEKSIGNIDSLEVAVFINHSSPLQTNLLKVDVWEKETRSIEYDKFVESKKYQIQPDWEYAFFKYYFTKPGDYKFNIYNQNEVLITSGFFRVNR